MNSIPIYTLRGLPGAVLLLALIVILPSSSPATDYTLEAEIRVINETYVAIYGLAVGDWDNDGDVELLANHAYYIDPPGTPELVAYIFQSGSGYVEERRIPNVSMGRAWARPSGQLIISDIDDDGLNELIFPGLLDGNRGIHILNVTPLSFSEDIFIPGMFWDIAVGDVDGNGLDELVGITDNQVSVFSVNSTGYTTDWTRTEYSNLVRIGNVDNDSYNEIVLGTGDVDVRVYGFDGNTYNLEGSGTSDGYDSKGLGIGDFDSDGDAEILRVGYHGTVLIYGRVGSNWIVEDTWNVKGNDNPLFAISGNLDGNPAEEIIIAYGNYVYAEAFQVFKYNSTNMSYYLDWTSGVYDGCGRSLLVGDPDDDGYLELVTGSRSQAYVRIFAIDYGAPEPRPPRNLRAVLSGGGFSDVSIGWDLSPDDGGGVGGVAAYDIYRSTSYDSQGLGYSLYDSVPNGTNTYTDVNAGEGDPNNYFYRVCTVDLQNNITCAEDQAAKFTRPLLAGPNLISIPLVQHNASISKTLQTVRFDKVWTYDSQRGNWESHMTFKPYLGDLRTVNHMMGLWADVTEDSNLTVAGIVPSMTQIQVRAGWSLVGYPSYSTTYTVGDLKSETGATRVEGFDASNPPYFLKALNDMDNLRAGHGYWVCAETDVRWTVDNS